MGRLNENGNYCVYVHTSPSNKAYIGITSKDIKERWGLNGSHYKKNKHFWNAIQKYGWDNFKHEVLFENLTKEKACKIEILLIALFNTQNPDFGYNISPGGELGITGCHLSDETKQKISEANKGLLTGEKNPMHGVSPRERMDEDTYNSWLEQTIVRVSSEEFKEKMRKINTGKKYSDEVNKKKGRQGSEHPMFGKHHTEETKEKIRQGNLGKKDSEETKKKKSEAMRGDKNPFFGKTHNEESLKKMSEAQRNRCADPAEKLRRSESAKKQFATPESRERMSKLHSKPVFCIDMKQCFPSALAAKRNTGISNASISNCCLCKPNCITAGGYRWAFVYDVTKKNGEVVLGAISLGYIAKEEIKYV